MEYFDIHAHVFPVSLAEKAVGWLESYYGYRWEGKGVTDDLLASMDSSAVRRAVIFSSATKPTQVRDVNDFLAKAQRENPGRFFAFGTLHPDYGDLRGELARMRELGLHGLKFHPDFQHFAIDDPRMFRIYELVGDTLPMLFHVGDRASDLSSTRRLAAVLDAMPELRVVAAHFGGYHVWAEARRRLIGRDLWIDTSSTLPYLPVAEAAQMAREHGLDRVLFASDYPAVRHKRAIDDVLKCGFTPEENEKVFHLNAERLLGLAPSGRAGGAAAI